MREILPKNGPFVCPFDSQPKPTPNAHAKQVLHFYELVSLSLHDLSTGQVQYDYVYVVLLMAFTVNTKEM
jgi:hypothetical protein